MAIFAGVSGRENRYELKYSIGIGITFRVLVLVLLSYFFFLKRSKLQLCYLTLEPPGKSQTGGLDETKLRTTAGNFYLLAVLVLKTFFL